MTQLRNKLSKNISSHHCMKSVFNKIEIMLAGHTNVQFKNSPHPKITLKDKSKLSTTITHNQISYIKTNKQYTAVHLSSW